MVALMQQLKDLIKQHHDGIEATLLSQFADRYFGSLAESDLASRPLTVLYPLLLSHWQLIFERAPQDVKIHIFNPTKEKEGWTSPHTVIQIAHNDMPFLVDSIRMALKRYGYEVHFIVHFGGFKVKRDAAHRITQIYPVGTKEANAATEAPIHIEIDKMVNAKAIQELHADIARVLRDVRVAVTDWAQMVERAKSSLKSLEASTLPFPEADVSESRDFLAWLINNNFTFLGARDYKLIGDTLQIVPGSGLGVLRDELLHAISNSYADLPAEAHKIALSQAILTLGKTDSPSTVHRDTYTDYLVVKQFDEKGTVIGERRFIGLYTSTAYHTSPKHIPFLRLKVQRILQELNLPADSHDGKEALHILETLPRDDLLQATHEELLSLTLNVLQLKERKRLRLLVRRDVFCRYFSCLVYMPHERFTTDLALAMQATLMRHLKGIECTISTYFSESVLARLHFLIRVNPKTPIDVDVQTIEKEIIQLAYLWTDELKRVLTQHYGEAEGLRRYEKYSKAFPTSYTETYSAEEALKDIEKMESLKAQTALAMRFNRVPGTDELSLKLFHAEQTIVLSDVLPILENMGLKIIGESPYCVKLKDGSPIWINDFDMTYVSNKDINVVDIRDIFKAAFSHIWFGEVENDGFNRLVLTAHLTWQETRMLRAYTKYLRQTGFTFSEHYIETALINNADITRALTQLFLARFNPLYPAATRAADITTQLSFIERSLDNVVSLDEDRILRRLLECMLATTRTNYFQTQQNGEPKPYLSFKFDPQLISDLPLPRPKFEIFVYSRRMEGVHLRAGKVARGGLRWSDRREDFRTEVLGLMKAQSVKNTLIVPQGAKGGFVVKQAKPEWSRETYFEEGVACYRLFVCGLLDLTDNIENGVVVPPPQVLRYDEDDPYLVVAADKGTATFSDIANRIAADYGFWLDDAFASGGSAGYDHKKMGITSRGAWVSVKRHLRELDIDPTKDDFTVVGIGDMSGDVFGNGMLRSPHIQLIGAFNHMHIFLDPNPDAAVSFQERKRLFNLPRSNWTDYNLELISKGGGVFNRSAKSIKLSPEIQAVLNTTKESMVPNELIRTLLKARVDLIWNGGIGTFVKASNETHADVGDRTSDNIRVDATELNARAIAEGGNLGLTQLARIEYSLQGGIVNTDFIDNSAGVDCSDHEVNIKILLNRLIADGKMTKEERNALLGTMTDEVAELVLQDNYDQTQMLALETSVSQQTMDLLRHGIQTLEKEGRLNRKLEYLPDDKTLIERKANNKPLTRPEIAMLLAYCKMYLKQDLLATDVPDDAHFDQYLLKAFPQPLRENYLPQMKTHSLRREIVATQLCKGITDRMGINFIERLQRETGVDIAFVVRSFSIAEHIYHLEDLWQQVSHLDHAVSPLIQNRMMLQLYYLIRRATRWFLRNRKPNIDIQKTINDFSPAIETLLQHIPDLLDTPDHETFDATINYLVEQSVPSVLARRIAACNALFTSLDIAEAARKYELPLTDVAHSYYMLGNRLELNWLREQMGSYAVTNEWDELARAGFRDDLDRVQGELSARVLTTRIKEARGKTIPERIDAWINRYQFLTIRWQKLISDIKTSENIDFVTYAVVLRELFDFALAT